MYLAVHSVCVVHTSAEPVMAPACAYAHHIILSTLSLFEVPNLQTFFFFQALDLLL